MIILINLKGKTITLLIVSFLIFSGLGIYLFNLLTESSTIPVDEKMNNMLFEEIEQIFKKRNKALLTRNINILEGLYNKEIKTGNWAYEHELKRMKYLHKWSKKQGIKFKEINSQINITRVEKKDDGFLVNLAVSTEYEYVYQDSPETYNSFRLGTYHSLNLMPQNQDLVITKEWYRDPFADSLHLDKINNQKIKQLILSKEPKDLSNLNKKRVKALKYVDKHCGAASPSKYGIKYNSKYKNYNYQGGDCANFASQMLYEAGGFSKNNIWNYKQGKGTKAWVNAHAFNRYMINSGRGTVIAHGSYDKTLKPSYKLLPGDYIAYEKKGGVVHISIVTGVDSKGYILVNSHNSDRYRVPWDLGWSNKEIKFWLIRVHY